MGQNEKRCKEAAKLQKLDNLSALELSRFLRKLNQT